MHTVEVVYVSYNGIGEPLVESQVLAYLRELVPLGFRFTLVTMERDNWSASRISAQRARLPAGIDWLPATSRLRARKLRDLSLLLQCLRLVRGRIAAGAAIVHARSFIPALAARCLKLRYPVKLVYDIRGFWIEEKVYKGTLRRNGLAHRLGLAADGWIYRGSDHIVSLTRAAERVIASLPCFAGRPVAPISVIPTCVDIPRFALPRPAATAARTITVGYVGSLGDSYLPGETFRFFARLRARLPNARLHLVSRAAPAEVAQHARAAGVGSEDFLLEAVDFDAVPARLAGFDLGLSFIKPGTAKIASCPTKLGEYLAAGVPVVANAGIGDVDALLPRSAAGIVVEDCSDAAFDRALDALPQLLNQPGTAAACRALAGTWFALEHGVRQYAAIYRQLLQPAAGQEP